MPPGWSCSGWLLLLLRPHLGDTDPLVSSTIFSVVSIGTEVDLYPEGCPLREREGYVALAVSDIGTVGWHPIAGAILAYPDTVIQILKVKLIPGVRYQRALCYDGLHVIVRTRAIA